MTTLYFITLIACFLAGYYDGKNMTLFGIILLCGIINIIMDKYEKRRKRRKNQWKK